ncbi:hypothetical protein ACF3DV_20620 [Chlorogloeopsis fritschii PCC 9212]|uniref:Uncharacterized protein n=1 Tax=Chlorogloeopsis fritschii PCC 6912 TaxID=211165 RepID=A0A3S1FSJ0_CHLFR|nr:hypothetical protein [Chlorogloeopsis fritschii]RUR84707.1 hypothetical protein PCC6912_16020 [Chlorogloeopsis fritschii PCC 6912]
MSQDNLMSDLELHNYFSRLPEEALKEFTDWCIFEQAIAAGYEFTPDRKKLEDLEGAYYIEELVDQFVKATRNTIEGGLAALLAGTQADKNALKGIPIVVDFISLYVKYLAPKGKNNTLPVDEKLAQASQDQLDKLREIAKKYNVEI